MLVNNDLIKKIQTLDSGEFVLPDDENKNIEATIKIHAYTFENKNWLAYSLKLTDRKNQNSCERVFYQNLKNIKIDSSDFLNSYFQNLKKLLFELENFNEDF